MFPTFGRAEHKGRKVPLRAKNFLKWRIYAIADKLKVPRKLVTFQVMRRTLGTDLQKHGTMKDAQGALRHTSIKTTAGVYMQEIPASVRAAIRSRTRAILAKQQEASRKLGSATIPRRGECKCLERMAPQVGLEPTTLRLTAGCYTGRALILKGVITVPNWGFCWTICWTNVVLQSGIVPKTT